MKAHTSFYAPIGISARHVHLSEAHVQRLFGGSLHVDRELSQGGEFAAVERVTIAGTRHSFHSVRVLGPPRKQTQVEISMTDAVALKMRVPVRLSGNLKGTPGITLVGAKGSVTLDSGVIVAARHLHITPMEATRYGLKQNQQVEALLGTDRRVIYRNIIVRISQSASLELHLDTDEANAAGVANGDMAQVFVPPAEDDFSNNSGFLCVEDVQRAISSGNTIRLTDSTKITQAALELARKKGIIIE